MIRKLIFITIVCAFVAAPVARADLFGFGNISANNVADAAIGEAQLSVEVTDAGIGQVLFTFSNSGPWASSITDIYFDDGALLAIASIDNSDPGVSFSQLAKPSNLPSANNAYPPFMTTAGFSADSDPPVQPMGVNPTETVGITFNLKSGQSFADVIDALNVGFNPDLYYDGSAWTEPDLRIGIKVQGFDSGGSESFVAVPVPGAVLLGMLGLSVAGLKLRKYA